ncbi:MAG TPA: 30S ribosomal protein S6 [Bacteroidia bacterium]|jgi:small subunit ribosomal protein S6|nr:30S ribosomal protein S6 [Bacteroidia bacterium]
MALELSIDFSGLKVSYETTFLVSPELSEADYRKVSKKFEDLITKGGGEVTNVEHWGQKKLAYPIDKRHNAYYCYMEFTSPASVIPKLEQEYLYDESLIRFLTVRVEKHHAAFNKKRREQGFGKKKEATK